MAKDGIHVSESIQMDTYAANADVKAWVAGSFVTGLERSAAWAMYSFLCNKFKGVHEIVRGELKSSEKNETFGKSYQDESGEGNKVQECQDPQ